MVFKIGVIASASQFMWFCCGLAEITCVFFPSLQWARAGCLSSGTSVAAVVLEQTASISATGLSGIERSVLVVTFQHSINSDGPCVARRCGPADEV